MKTMDIAVSSITGGDDRKEGGQGDIAALAKNIERFGQINSIVVIDEEGGTYRIVAGRRRVAAFKYLARPTIRADVYGQGELSDEAEIGLAENTAREEMNPLDEGIRFAEMLANGESAKDIALLFCRTQSQVYQRAKLSALIPEFKELFKQGRLVISVAAFIAELPPDMQQKLWDAVCKRKDASEKYHDWMVRNDLANISHMQIGDAFDSTKCAKCMKRTRGTDETLFPDLEIGGDYCLDVKCWEKEWAKSIERSYKKFEQANENVSELPILYSGKAETVFPASLLGEGRIKLGDRWHEIIKDGQVFTIASWQRDYEKPSKLRAAGKVHTAIYFYRNTFTLSEYCTNEDWNDCNANPSEQERRYLEQIYASLPDAVRERKIQKEFKNRYTYQSDTSRIGRIAAERLNDAIENAVIEADDIPRPLLASVAVFDNDIGEKIGISDNLSAFETYRKALQILEDKQQAYTLIKKLVLDNKFFIDTDALLSGDERRDFWLEFLSDLGICARGEAETYVAKVVADAVSQVLTVKENTAEENSNEESDTKN